MMVSAARLAALLDGGPWRSPAYRDLAERLRALIVDGRLVHRSRLPSERALAAALDLSRTTVTHAYALLREAGLTEARRGSGTRVMIPLAQTAASSILAEGEGTVVLTYAAPPAPAGLGAIVERATSGLPALLRTSGYLPDGLPRLRELIAEDYRARGLPTDPAQIVVTSGALGALALVARALLRPGDRVLTEAVGYPHGFDTFSLRPARLTPMPFTEEPWDTEAAESIAATAGPRALYLTPEFHNPTGAVMSAEVRGRLARAARRHDVVPIVDESLRRLDLDGHGLPDSFAVFDDRTVIVDSLSKAFWGGLRIGWIRAPRELVTTLVQTRMALDLGTAAFEQLIAAELLEDPQKILDASLATLRERRAVLLDALSAHFPAARVIPSGGGLSVWLRLPSAGSTRLTAAAAEAGIALTPGPRYFSRPGPVGENYLRLPYAAEPTTLAAAVRTLAAVWAAGVDGPKPAERSADLDFIA